MLRIPEEKVLGDLVSPLKHPVTAKYHHSKQASKHVKVIVYSVRSETNPLNTYPVRIYDSHGEIRGVECECPAHRNRFPPDLPIPCKHIATALRHELIIRKEAHRYGIVE